jgi:hypothetical protein
MNAKRMSAVKHPTLPTEIPRKTPKHNITRDLKETDCEDWRLMKLAQGHAQWQPLVLVEPLNSATTVLDELVNAMYKKV